MSADSARSEPHPATPQVAPRQPPQSSSIQLISKIPRILPHERVFPIQIGSELFKLSGASISSDAPSYFSQYFQCQIKKAEESGEDISTAIRTLYIDRDPLTFRDISLHLQGYHVQPRDGTHFVRLFADAQFYSLPKLISQLHEESIFMSIGHHEFQIPRDLFQEPGNSPNFFSLGFAIFFSSPEDLFPGLDREGLIRPPSILPPSVPNRSAEIFAELLHLLRGYPLHIRNEAHRASLLRDCKYFNFKGIEQKLIPHSLSFNQARRREEIAVRLGDILKSGISVACEPTITDSLAGWVNYARPFVDDKPAELVLEIDNEATKVYLASRRAEFFRDARARIARLFEVIATKLNLPPTTQPLGLLMTSGGASSQPATPGNTPLSEDLVHIVLEPETSITLDGYPYTEHVTSGPGNADDVATPSSGPSSEASVETSALPQSLPTLPLNRKRRRIDSSVPSESEEWVVRTGQWRLRIQGAKSGKSAVECVLVAVKLDVMSSEHARNVRRPFLNL
ncbi:BTB/POZ domain-containing protein-like protein [Pleurostoma richardsiae]|uniref:BTB/POZ domain-containing protein-like protein n=1 Tax=Pleurostoma richardsiae TaxID=41990 RepID=A0AA38VGC2_9PEZI|nr:BTB/POZ domain-containing protein-like protein [Pleurostoma richardsiae]